MAWSTEQKQYQRDGRNEADTAYLGIYVINADIGSPKRLM